MTRTEFLSLSDSPDGEVSVGQRPAQGVVQIDRFAPKDTLGHFTALLATWFSSAYLKKHLPDLYKEEFDTLLEAGVFDGERVFTGLAGESWTDRAIHVADTDAIASDVEFRWKTGKHRTWLVPFTDGRFTPGATTVAEREKIVRDQCEAFKELKDAFMCIEPVNEIGDDGKLENEEAREIAREYKRALGVPVTISSSNDPWHMASLYYNRQGYADFINQHYERDETGTGRMFEWIQKPDERWLEDSEALKDFNLSPQQWAQGNGEPKAPGSSLLSDYDPQRLGLSFWLSMLLGNCFHVFHNGPGIRSGGAWDTTDPRGAAGRLIWPLPTHFRDIPHWKEIIASFAAAKRELPGDIANARRIRGHRPENPIDTIAYRNPNSESSTGMDNGPYDDGTIFKSWFVGNKYIPMLRLKSMIKVRHRTEDRLFEVLDTMTGEVRHSVRGKAGEYVDIHPAPPRPDAWKYDGDGFVIRCT